MIPVFQQAAQILLFIVGAFYLVGGVMVIRALGVDEMAGTVLAVFEGTAPQKKDTVRRWLLTAAGVLTSIGGAALVTLSALAVPLFIANLALQIIWLVWARSAFPPEDEDDATGRRRTRNAAVGYAAATLALLWFDRTGRLAAWDEPMRLIILGAFSLGLIAWTLRTMRWPRRRNTPDASDDDGSDEEEDAPSA